MKRLVVDWSVLMHMNWHKMRSPNFQARTGLEVAEFARLIVGHALYLVERIQPDELILAVDASPNWRSAVYSRFYDHRTEFFRYIAKEGERIWVVQFDRKTFLVKYRPDMDRWTYEKQTKAGVKDLDLGNLEAWEPWAMEVEENRAAIRTLEDWPALEHIVPQYKGNRKTSRWEYETPKDEFKALGANLAFNLAPVLGGVAVQVPLAEGDDICAGFVGMHQEGDETVLVSIDSDLHQLLATWPELRIFDPRLHTWVDKSPERALYDLTHKILTGDTSDNIAGVGLNGAGSTLGDKSAATVISDHGGPEAVWEWLWENTDRAALERNLELVALTEIPAGLRQEIEDALLGARGEIQSKASGAWREAPEFTLEDFGLSQADLITTRTTARLDRELDEGLREGDPMTHETLEKGTP